MPYTSTTWTNGSTAMNATHMNNLETQYTEATSSFEQDLFTAFVFSGFVATKDGSVANKLDVTSGVAFLTQADSTLRRRAVTSSNQTTSALSSTYHLYLQPDGTWYWSTSNSPAANSLWICDVATDGSGNISTVTDKRTTGTTLLSGMLGSVTFPGGALTLTTLTVTGTSSLDNGSITTDALGTVSGKGQAALSAPSVAAASGAGLSIGVYKYQVSFYTSLGESILSSQVSVTTTSGNQKVNVTSIPLGPAGTVGRKLYRTTVGGSSGFLLTTIADNTTTTYADTTADGSLGAAAPAHPSLGGDIWKNSSNATQAQIYADGAVSFDQGNITSNGAGTLTATALSAGSGAFAVNSSGGVTSAYLNYHAASSGNPLRIYENGSSSNGFEIGRIGTDGNGTNNSCIAVLGTGGIGFKTGGISGTKIMEISPAGKLTVTAANPSFVTTNSTVGFAASALFDAFDVAESYETDAPYKRGEVLCPSRGGRLTRCAHDKCRAAMVVSTGGALNIGGLFENDGSMEISPIALAGRVLAETAEQVSAFDESSQPTLVTSDGKGGVRAMRTGEYGFALGFALTESHDGLVGIFVRPMYCQA